MRIARESRGFAARDVRHLPVLAKSAGALFIRSYERGERVHLAMLSRGYTGSMPVMLEGGATAGDWAASAVLPPPPWRPPFCLESPVTVSSAFLPGEPAPSLRVAELAYAYPDGTQALFGVDLTISAGERVALLGPNGAGKTTLVMHLNGILTAGHGTVEVAGLPVREGHAQGDPPPGRHRLPGSRRPALHAHGPRGRRVRPGQPRRARSRAGARG